MSISSRNAGRAAVVALLLSYSPGVIARTDASPRCRDWFPDCDGDFFGDTSAPLYSCGNPNTSGEPAVCHYVRVDGDCNDADRSIHPLAQEGPDDPDSTSDGVDNDCDGFVDIDCADDLSGSGSPLVAIESPIRGVWTTTADMAVSGVVYPSQDRAPIASISVDGVAASFEPCSTNGGSRFAAVVPLETGIQSLEVLAEDQDLRSDRALTSVIRADSWLDMEEPIDGALVALLNQGTWNILGDYVEGTYTADEIEAALLAANPLVQESGDGDCTESWDIYATATAYDHDDTEVSFTVTGGRIKTTARIVKPRIWASGWVDYDLEWYCGEWSDRVYMDAYGTFSEVKATADGTLALNADGQIQIAFSNVVVTAAGASIDVDADDWLYDWLLDLFEEELAEELEKEVEGELYAYVTEDLGPALSEEVNSLELDYDVELLGTTYGVSFEYDALSVPEGSVVLGFGMGLSYAVDRRIPRNPGAVALATTYQLNTSPTFVFKVGSDFFNGALHALWEGGGLYLDETLSESPLITALTTPLLPPVVVPGANGYLLDLGLGDMLVDMSVTGADGVTNAFQAALSTHVTADLDTRVDGQTIAFDVTFGPATVAYDLVGADPIPEELIEVSELAMAKLVDLILDELEVYLESLEISYLDLPLTITALPVSADPTNPAMMSVDGTAVYTGP